MNIKKDMSYKAYLRLFAKLITQELNIMVPRTKKTKAPSSPALKFFMPEVNPMIALPRLPDTPKLLALGPANPKLEAMCNDFWDSQTKLKEAVNIDSTNVKKISRAVADLKKTLKEKYNINVGNLEYKTKYSKFMLFKREYKVSSTPWFKPGEPPVIFLSQTPDEFAQDLPKPLKAELKKRLTSISNLINGQKIKILFARFGNELDVGQKTTATDFEYLFKHENIKDVLPYLKTLTLVGDVETKSHKLFLPQ